MSVEINPLIFSQVFEASVMFVSGVILMILLDIFETIKKWLKPGRKAESLMDMVFWLFVSLLSISFLHYASYGKMSIHVIISFGLGILLWKNTFYGRIKLK